jgi:uncharacterized protein (TIGR00255 family)
MTGFGRAATICNNSVFEIEIKSINSRYLDILIKVPQSVSNKEYELREIIKSKFNRGKLSLIVTKKNGNGSNEISGFDSNKLKNYLLLIKEIKRQVKLKEKIKLEHILANKDIFSSSVEDLPEEEFEKLKVAIVKASDDLIKMKKKEGIELEKDLIQRLKNIETKVQKIESIISVSINDHFENYKLKVIQLLNQKSAELYDDRLKFELALLAEKSDISEECVRLKSHLKFFLEAMKKESEPGRKLNFLCQEMNREANTISAKSLSLEITHKTIEIKEEIERIREQIQNVE